MIAGLASSPAGLRFRRLAARSGNELCHTHTSSTSGCKSRIRPVSTPHTKHAPQSMHAGRQQQQQQQEAAAATTTVKRKCQSDRIQMREGRGWCTRSCCLTRHDLLLHLLAGPAPFCLALNVTIAWSAHCGSVCVCVLERFAVLHAFWRAQLKLTFVDHNSTSLIGVIEFPSLQSTSSMPHDNISHRSAAYRITHQKIDGQTGRQADGRTGRRYNVDLIRRAQQVKLILKIRQRARQLRLHVRRGVDSNNNYNRLSNIYI